jgi:hypothetical protein
MNYHRISSPRTKILWAGWESDISRLQEQGWQISAEHDIYSMNYRFALKHPSFRIYGITEPVRFDSYYDGLIQSGNPFGDLPIINVRFMASRLDIRLNDDLSKFTPIDTQPSFIEYKEKSIEDFMIFRPIGKANEIILVEQEVPELLDLILKKQSPQQAEIREKKRKEWRKFTTEINGCSIIDYEKIEDNRNNIVAQLITL